MREPKSKSMRRVFDIQNFLKSLYPNNHLDIDYIYGYTARNASYLCKKITLGNQTKEDFVKSISWLLAIANKLEIDTQNSIIKRFPGVCPYCIASPCICFRTRKSPVDYIPAYKAKEELLYKFQAQKSGRENYRFDDFIRDIQTIYPNNEIVWEYGGPWRHLVKVQEEVAELHEAFSHYISKRKPLESVSDELADSLAWICSGWGILFSDISLDEHFIDYYYEDCPVCHNHPCSCQPRMDRISQLIDPLRIQEIEVSLKELFDVLNMHDPEIEDLKRSLAIARETYDEPVARRAIATTKRRLRIIADSVSSADENGRKISSMVESVMRIIDLLPF